MSPKPRSTRRGQPDAEPKSSPEFHIDSHIDPALQDSAADERAVEGVVEQGADEGLGGRLGALAQTILSGHVGSERSVPGQGGGEGDVMAFGEDGDQLFGEHGNPEFGQLLQAVGEHERKRTEAEALQERDGYPLDHAHDGTGTFDPDAPNHLEDADHLLEGSEQGRSLLRDSNRVLGKRGPSRKRNHEEEAGQDPIRLKKDAHKEVERRRRATINDGYADLARLLPERNSRGAKSMVLSLAADHMANLTERVSQQDEELGKLRSEKVALTSEIQLVNDRLGEEQARSLRFEQSWREAEDRCATAQFELERLKAAIEELRK